MFKPTWIVYFSSDRNSGERMDPNRQRNPSTETILFNQFKLHSSIYKPCLSSTTDTISMEGLVFTDRDIDVWQPVVCQQILVIVTASKGCC